LAEKDRGSSTAKVVERTRGGVEALVLEQTTSPPWIASVEGSVVVVVVVASVRVEGSVVVVVVANVRRR